MREKKKGQEKKQERGLGDSKWEKHATAEMRIRNGEITRQQKAGTRTGWEEGKYSPGYYFL